MLPFETAKKLLCKIYFHNSYSLSPNDLVCFSNTGCRLFFNIGCWYSQSPESVMAGAPSPPSETPSLSARDKEGGLVAPPVEEGPPQLREARAVLQSQQQRLQPGQGSAQPSEPELKTANAEPVLSAWHSQGTPSKPTSYTIAEHGANSTVTPHSPTKVVAMDTLSDDETPADLLAEALAVADVVASNNKVKTCTHTQIIISH